MIEKEFKPVDERNIQPSHNKEGWVTYSNEDLKYRISFPENWESNDSDLPDHFGVKNFVPIEDFYEDKLDSIYFSSTNMPDDGQVQFIAFGLEVYPDNISLKKNIM